MSASTAAAASTSAYTPAFWERLWRQSGIHFVVLFVVAYLIYDDASPARILVAAVFAGVTVLNLLWFAAAIRTTLADAGQDGWGAAATAASAVLGGLLLLLVAMAAAFAHSIADIGDETLTSALNSFAWAGVVLTSFPRAMLIMAGTFGLWRAKLISNTLFAVGVAVVVLVLLGGTTWVSGGFWAPDGAYSRFVSPLLGLVWVLVVSRVLLTQAPAMRTGW